MFADTPKPVTKANEALWETGPPLIQPASMDQLWPL